MSLTTEQITNRTTGIGGSDAAAACGLSRWRTPLDVYLEKRGEAPPFTGNEFTKWGEALEPAIRQEYANQTGRVVRRPDETLRHPLHDWMLCHPDGVTEDGRLFEAKNTRFGGDWGAPGTDEIPVEYMLQVQHNMAVMGLKVADVAVLISGCDWRLYEVHANEAMQESIIRIEGVLWSQIKSGYPPPPQNTNDLIRLYGDASAERPAVADDLVDSYVIDLQRLHKERDEIDAEIAKAEFEVKAFMKDAERLVTPEGKTLATWRSHKRGEKVVRPFKLSDGGL